MTQAIVTIAKNDPSLQGSCLAFGALLLMAASLPPISLLDEMPASRRSAIASDSGENAPHIGLEGLKLDGIAFGGEASISDLDRHSKAFTAEEQRRGSEQPTNQRIQ